MGIKEGTFRDEHWVSYVRDESLGSTSEAKTTLYVNWLENKLKKKCQDTQKSGILPIVKKYNIQENKPLRWTKCLN